MNTEKVQQEINKLVDSNRLNRQYPANKKQLAELTELGLIDFMPICQHPSVKAIGHTDAAKVIAAAKDSGHQTGGFNAYGEGDVVNAEASDLYKALHEIIEAVEEDKTETFFDKVLNASLHAPVLTAVVVNGNVEREFVWQPLGEYRSSGAPWGTIGKNAEWLAANGFTLRADTWL